MEMRTEVPNKSLFKVDEVCGLTGVKPYVLRFWESEFPEIAPISSTTGQKMYAQKDIEVVTLIKRFLFDEKLSIEKAKLRMMESTQRFQSSQENSEVKEVLVEEKKVVEEIKVVEVINEINEIKEEPLEKTGFSELDWEKLTFAKEKIEKLVFLADAIKERHYWN